MTNLDATINIRQQQSDTIYVEWTILTPYPIPSHWLNSTTFKFCDCSWYLRIFPWDCDSVRRDIRFYLVMENPDQNSKIMTFVLGIKETDGTMHEKSAALVSFGKGNSMRGWSFDVREPTRKWILSCYIIRYGPLEMEPKQQMLQKLNTLCTNLNELFVSGKHSDATIRVEDSEFPVHKAILAARSPALAAAFEHDMVEQQTGVITIEDCCPDSFRYFLEYLYSGTIANCPSSNIYQLYIIADKYNEQELKSFCFLHLMSNLTVENVCDVARLAEQYDEAGLMDKAQSFFVQSFNRIIFTAEWEKLLKENYRLANKILQYLASRVETKK